MTANGNEVHPGDVSSADLSGIPKRSRRELVARGLLALLGIGLIGAGIAAIFVTKKDVGVAILVGIGSLLMLFAVFSDQLESLRFGDLELVLRRKADEAARRGDLEAAKVLERAADTIGQRVAKTASAYKSVRTRMSAGGARTQMMEDIIAEAKRDAYARDIDQEEVLNLLWTGSEGARVWALGVLEARPEFATPRAVLEAVQHPDAMFDQFHALVLADLFVKLPTTETWARERVVNAARFQRDSGALGNDQDCHAMVEIVVENASRSRKIR